MIDYHNWTRINVAQVELMLGYKPTGINSKGETEYSCVCRECTHKLLSMTTSLESLQRGQVPCDCIPQVKPVEIEL